MHFILSASGVDMDQVEGEAVKQVRCTPNIYVGGLLETPASELLFSFMDKGWGHGLRRREEEISPLSCCNSDNSTVHHGGTDKPKR